MELDPALEAALRNEVRRKDHDDPQDSAQQNQREYRVSLQDVDAKYMLHDHRTDAPIGCSVLGDNRADKSKAGGRPNARGDA